MSVVSKSRALIGRALRIQRRVAVTQALFWPVALSAGVVALGAAAFAAKGYAGRTNPPPSDPTPPDADAGCHRT